MSIRMLSDLCRFREGDDSVVLKDSELVHVERTKSLSSLGYFYFGIHSFIFYRSIYMPHYCFFWTSGIKALMSSITPTYATPRTKKSMLMGIAFAVHPPLR